MLLIDLKHQLRWLARTPAFACSALITLALGVGITTAIFALVHGVLLRPLPFPEAERLGFMTRSVPVSIPDGVDWRARAHSWESIGLFARNWTRDLTGVGDPEPISIYAVEPDFFRVLGIDPLAGRLFSPEDNRPGGSRVALITESFWRARFGADASVIGRTLTLSGDPTTIIGVVPEAVDFLGDRFAAIVPIGAVAPRFNSDRGSNNLAAIGRIKRGVPFEQARRELGAISTALSHEYPRTNQTKIVDPVPLTDFITGGVKPALLLALSAVATLLLIATVNLAGLLVARVTTRRRELEVRLALGASPGRIFRQLVTEGLVLGAVGGALGLVVAQVALGFLRRTLAESLPRTESLNLGGPVLLFAVGLAAASGLLCGLVPALFGRGHRDTGELGSARGSSERGRHRALRVVVASEIALAVALLAAAGVVIKSFDRLWHQPLGFEPDRLLSAQLALPAGRFGTREAQDRIYTAIVDRLQATPGVIQVAYAATLPLDRGGSFGNAVLFEGREFPADRSTGASLRPVYGDYFGAMRIAIVKGRSLNAGDREGTAPVAVVNQAFARAFFDGVEPIGQRIALRDWHEFTPGPVWMTVVGVANDVKAFSMAEGDSRAIYIPYLQRQMGWLGFGSLVVRTAGEPAAFGPELKRTIWTVDALLAPARIETLADRRSASVARERLLAVVLSLFAVSAVLLVMQGLWSIVAYAVADRRREIGVRVALGATPYNIVGLVTREAISPMALGALAGTALAVAGSRLLRQAVFEVSPTDPTVLGLTVVGLVAVTLLASALPAWRATRIDPLEALKAE